MERGGDKLVFDLNGRRIALELTSVDSVVEVPRVYFMPGQTGPVKGIISRRGAEVMVVDMRKVLGLTELREGKNKIIIVKDRKRILGLYIGGGNCSFLWKEDLEGAAISDDPSPELPEKGSKFTFGLMEKDGKPIELLDWVGLYDETTSILSKGVNAGEDTHS
jgi:chemotaxis signal transduction protein